MDQIQRLFNFIAAAPTAFHAAAAAAERLAAAGFAELREDGPWDLRPGGACFLTRNGASLIAFRLPAERPEGFRIAASHSDSPAFRLKRGGAFARKGYCLLGTEPYGGGIYSTWADRPLSVAGRLLVREGTALRTRLVDLDRDVTVIPSLPVHFNRQANEGTRWDPKCDTVPLLGEAEDREVLEELLARAAGVRREDVVDGDLYLYLRQRGCRVGLRGEYLLCPRLDDLECAFATLEAFLEAEPGDSAMVYALFDSEEVGSSTRQGADSTLLSDTLERICAALGLERPAALARSLVLSADNAHALHPNHPELYDEENCVRMNGGVVIKYNASQRYGSDAFSAGLFRELCRRGGVPVQSYHNRSDLPGGSTLGCISTRHISVPTVDVGLAQLAMHASCETAGAEDLAHLTAACRVFFSAPVTWLGDGACALPPEHRP